MAQSDGVWMQSPTGLGAISAPHTPAHLDESAPHIHFTHHSHCDEAKGMLYCWIKRQSRGRLRDSMHFSHPDSLFHVSQPNLPSRALLLVGSEDPSVSFTSGIISIIETSRLRGSHSSLSFISCPSEVIVGHPLGRFFSQSTGSVYGLNLAQRLTSLLVHPQIYQI